MGLSVIAALSDNSVIGRQGALPWHLPADLAHFASLTMGHCIIMGRKTFESIGHPLPGRRSIVLTRATKPAFPGGVLVAGSLEKALELAMAREDDQPFVIGGEAVYREAFLIAARLYLTRVHGTFEGDALFPDFDQRQWHLFSRQCHKADADNPHDYTFEIYDRAGKEQ